MKHDPHMMSQVNGHVRANYDAYGDNYYQIDDIAVSSSMTDLQSMFEFDSWIQADSPDGFAVAISTNGGSPSSLLNPTAHSSMQYANIGSVCDSSLNVLTGQSTSSGATLRSFGGRIMLETPLASDGILP